MPVCPTCEEQILSLGAPSMARWLGPDGGIYCSLHFIQRFGHGERLVRIDGFEPPPDAPTPEEAPSGTAT
jgi:hypothetical protein